MHVTAVTRNDQKDCYIYITRNTWLANLAKLGLGGTALFTRIVASNEEIKRRIRFSFFDEHSVFVVPRASLRLKNLFLSRRNVQRACSAVVFDELISHGKLFTAATKRVISLMHLFTKKISKEREKILER